MAWDVVIAHGGNALLVVILTFSILRGRHRACWSFTAYLVVVLITGVLMAVWRQRFYNYEFYLFSQGLYDVSKLLVALEIAHRVFRNFPGAKPVVRLVVLALLAVSTLGFMAIPRYEPYQTWFEWQPRILASAVWLFTATSILILWYRIPVQRWHRDILIGFTAYLLVFVTLLGVLRTYGWDLRVLFGTIDTLAYLLLLVWWARSAARPAEEPAVAPAVAARLGIETV